MRSRTCKVQFLIAAGLVLAGLTAVNPIRADDVTEWNQHMLTALSTAGVSPFVATRDAALVSSAVFDALNGIERRYEPIHVRPAASLLTSRRAAVIQAAYAILVKRFPTQQVDLDAKRDASLSAIAGAAAVQNSRFIQRGIAWGQTVADEIWAWRSTDGFTPTPPAYNGGTAVGQWRPTPPGFASGAGVQFAYMTPWVMASPSQFRPPGPPALDSAQYTEDFEEVRLMGSLTSALRTDDETVACRFWGLGTTATYLWNSVAVSLSTARHASLSRNARLLAVLNLAMADAVIACWEAKYTYAFWRPVTAIPLADTDGNAATIADPLWTPLLGTPAHPEYPSGHSTVSGAAAEVLASHFGDYTSFTVDNDGLPGVTRSFTSFTAALEEVKEARIFAGIHFRTACDDGQASGIQAAQNVLDNAVQRFHRRGKGDKWDKGHGKSSDKK